MTLKLRYSIIVFILILASFSHYAFSQCIGNTLPQNTDFEGTFPPAAFTLNNPDGLYTFQKVPFRLIGRSGDSSAAIGIDFYDYQGVGELDELITVPYDLTGTTNPKLQFDIAYSRYDAAYFDEFQVLISTDCGTTFPDTIYYKSGDDAKGNTLPTVSDFGDNAFFPVSANQWRLEVVDLSAYIGDVVVLKFRAINGWGNNLFLDNILIGDCNILPTSDAGSDDGVCKNAATVNFAGSIANATASTWSGGEGSFSPNAADLNAVYGFSVNDTLTFIRFTLMATKLGCAPAYDFKYVDISSLPIADAGSDETICAGGSVSFNGSVSNSGGVTWTTSGTGSFSPNAYTLNASYTPSSGDISAGSVTLTLTVSAIAPCTGTDSDNKTVLISPCTGINNSINNLLSVYPNPAKEHIVISNNTGILKEVMIDLIDSYGIVIYHQLIKEMTEMKINTSDLKKGIYYIKVSGDGFSEVRKIAVE